MEFIRDIFLGGAYSLDSAFMEDGGPLCAAQMTDFYRLSVSAISLIFQFSIYWYFTRPYILRSQNDKKSQSPYMIEKLLGYSHIFVLLWQLVTKSITHRLIYMISPCHLVTAAQAYLLLSRSSKQTERHFTKVISVTMCAVVLPAPGNLTLPGEWVLFWVQHYLIAIVTPIILLLCGRYTASYQTNWKSMLYVTFTQGYHFFCFYQRLVTPIVILTWANLDFALCAAPKDFIYEIIGKYYYILGELYMFIVALAVAYPYIYLARLVRSLGKFKVE